MIDAYTQRQFTDACTRSANECAAASMSAFGDGVAQSMRLWSGAFDAWLGAWAGSTMVSSHRSRSPRAKLMPAPSDFAFLSPAWLQLWTAPANPFAIWLGLFATARMLGPMPVAGAMIAAGVPAGTAWPAAKAGSAAIDAVEIATKAMERAFSSYRSDGGHAVAQINLLPTVASAQTSAAGLWALNPWLALMRAR